MYHPLLGSAKTSRRCLLFLASRPWQTSEQEKIQDEKNCAAGDFSAEGVCGLPLGKRAGAR